MKFPLKAFSAFAGAVRISSKGQGVIPLTFTATQKYFLREIVAGLAEGVHDFLILKSRQIGYSTVTLALYLWWHLNFRGMQGLIVNDSDDNHDYFRDILREMMATLPDEYRLPVLIDNDAILRWSTVRNQKGQEIGGSRIGYQIAGASRRKQGKLGRGRGLNTHLGDELDYWTHTADIEALEDALSDEHKHRLYLRGSTANGYGVLYDMWRTAEPRLTRKIFVGSWLHERNRVERDTELWKEYGDRALTSDERIAVDEVARRYRVVVSPEHLAWRRLKLAVTFKGDDARLMQEHPMLPEEAFQAAGSKFIRPATIQRLRRAIEAAPAAQGYVYEWGARLDTCADPKPVPLEDATLKVWEEPKPDGAYLVGCVPMGSHNPESREHAITVWRIYPDWIVEVASYRSDDDATYQCAWATLHLCGAYHQLVAPFLALEIQATGRRVLEEIDRFMNTGFGLSEAVRASRNGVVDFLGNVRHYLYRRADSITRRANKHWLGANTLTTVLMHELRDQVERGYLEIRDPELVTQLATLRQGGDDDGDSIKAGGRGSDVLAVSAAIAVRHYVETAFPEIESIIVPREGMPSPESVDRVLFKNYLGNMMNAGRS